MRTTLTSWLALALTAATLAVAPALVADPAHAAVTAKVTRWVDGDTVVTSRGTIRLIGVDTPERGRCGYDTAKRNSARWAPPGSRIALTNPASVDDKDRYGRHLRYVNRGTRDVGASQIRAGAWARYDSRDGYDRHPRQANYRSLDAGHRNYCGAAHPSAGGSGSSAGGSTSGVSGAVAPSGKNCPASAPIKGNRGSMIYHRPGQQYYAVTTPEQCFRNAASAEAAGYRAARI